MNRNLKSIAIAGSLVLASLFAGCASVSVGPEEHANGNGGERPDVVLSQLEHDSRGK